MSKPKSELEKRLAQLKKEVPTRGFERHPSLLKRVSELPVELQSPDLPVVSASTSSDTIIAFPPQIQHGWSYIPRQALLFTPGSIIHLLASIWPSQPPQITTIDSKDLLYMRVTLLLLYGCLEIVSVGKGVGTNIKIEFNTVAWGLLSSPLEKFLQCTDADPVSSGTASLVPAVQQSLIQLPFKFSNGYYLHGQLPGEVLEELVFQPVTYKRWQIFPHRPALANTLLLLTTHFMVAIQDDPQVKLGWIIGYIPRRNITTMHSQPLSKWNELLIDLNGGAGSEPYKVLLRKETLNDWHKCWTAHGGQWLITTDTAEK